MPTYAAIPAAALTETADCHAPLVRLGPMNDLEAALAASWLDVSRATWRFLSLLREFDLRLGWQAYGCNDCAEWLDFKLKISRTTALEKLRVARALWLLPSIDTAFREGELSYSQVRALTRVADSDNVEALLDYARTATAEHLEQYCRRLRCGDMELAQQQARRDHASRSVQLYRHSGEISIKLPAEAFALVEQVLTQLVAALPADPARKPEAARADAFLTVFERFLPSPSAANDAAFEEEAGGSDSADAARSFSAHQPYQVLVHVDAAALSGEGGESDLPLPVVQRLCCDGPVVPILKSGGQILDVGRKQRTVPLAIKRALAARDRVCQFPGCHHTKYLDAHHIQHWGDGGATALDNLILICSHHHKLLHEGGFGMRAANGGYYFTRPDGRPVEWPSSAEDELTFSPD